MITMPIILLITNSFLLDIFGILNITIASGFETMNKKFNNYRIHKPGQWSENKKIADYKRSEWEKDYREIVFHIRKLYHLQCHMNSYFSLPLLVFLAYSTIDIISTVILSLSEHWGEDIHGIIFLTFNLTYNISSLSTISHFPDLVDGKVGLVVMY